MQEFLLSLENADPIWAYLTLFVSAFVENVFPPIPGDTVTVIGAYLVGRGIINFWAVYLVTTLGSILGFMAIYGIAYWVEWKIIEKHSPKWLSKTKIDKVEEWFNRYGYWVILMNRFLSGVRSVISLVAGLSRMKAVKVFILGLISCAVWNGGLIYAGAVIGKNWQEIAAFLDTYNKIVIIGVIAAITIFIGYQYYQRKKNITTNG